MPQCVLVQRVSLSHCPGHTAGCCCHGQHPLEHGGWWTWAYGLSLAHQSFLGHDRCLPGICVPEPAVTKYYSSGGLNDNACDLTLLEAESKIKVSA